MRTLSFTARLLEPPDIDIFLIELESSGWSLAGTSGEITYSVSDDDLTDENIAHISDRKAVLHEIIERSNHKRQSMLIISNQDRGSISLCFLPQENAFIVTAIYSCIIRELDGRYDLNDAVKMILPALEKSCKWVASYSVSVD
jgi:hypothetical protein